MAQYLSKCDRCETVYWNQTHIKPCTKADCECIARRCPCGGILVKMADKEIEVYKEHSRKSSADRVQKAREASILPEWCLSAISHRAYESGHPAGQEEVDSIECGMISEFDGFMKKSTDENQ